MRALPSRCHSRFLVASLFAAALRLGFGVPAFAADEGSTAPAGPCAPLPGDDIAPDPTTSTLCAGIAPSPGALPGGDAASGRIVTLPGAGALRDVESMPGEALLVLPRGAGGHVDTDFALAPGARIADSYWSPVLCATIVRVVGPAGTPPEKIVVRRPAGSRLSANKRYVTSATTLRPVVLAETAPQPAAKPGPAAGGALPATRSGPDDPYVPLQYGLARTGALAGRPALDGHGIRVAVLDSAPDVAHRELARVRIVTTDGAAPPPAATHGTLVAGVIGAAENNAFGIAGIAGMADVIAIPVCAPAAPGGDECRLDALLRGLDTAWREDARVANLSLVGPPDPLLEHAVRRMRELGILLVASVGNEASDEPRYPAAYPTVLGVGAFDGNGKPWPRSNRGGWVRVLAPGVEVLSTAPGDAFAFGDGTSLAAAHVSGMLALALMVTSQPLAAERALVDVARAGGSVAAVAAGPNGGVEIPQLCEVVARLGARCQGAP